MKKLLIIAALVMSGIAAQASGGICAAASDVGINTPTIPVVAGIDSRGSGNQ